MPDCLARAATTGQIASRRKRRRRPMLFDLAIGALELLFAFGSPLLHANGRSQAMHSQRRMSLLLLIPVMLTAGCLQYDCAPCQVTALPGGGMDARPLTVKELAHRAGLGERNAKRCLQDLREAGMLGKSPQIRRRDGISLLVAPKLRTFTEVFWKTLGLWDLFVESVRYAMEHQIPIRMRYPMTRIGLGPGIGRLPLKLPATVPKAVPMDRQLEDLAHACLQDRGGACDASGTSAVCRLCREARGLA